MYRARHTFDGIPVLKYLFEHVIDKYPKAQLYGFASADMLFDETLIVTLEHVMKKYDRKNELVILGRRTNAVVSLYGLRDFNDIRGLGKRVDSKLFNDGLAQDYFFVTKGAVPWDRIPDFLIGREGFNPWLTAYAINSNLATLDVTNTVLALHQKSSRDTVDYECRTNKLASVNKDIIGPSFDYSLGRIDCARFFTTFVESNPFHGSNQSITISARNPNPCARLFELYGITNNT